MAYKANMIRMSYEAPPWVRDPESADFWVTLQQAGQHYFRRTYKTMRWMLTNGTLTEFGFQTYFDGSRWWVRLPEVPPTIAKKDS